MKTLKYSLALLILAGAFSCKVEKKEEGELPDIDISAEAGELPEYDVDWANVDIGTTTKTVEIPKIVVIMEEEEVEVPYIDVKMPNEKEKEEQTIMVEAEVRDKEHKLEIQEIWVKDNKLWVISELEELNQDLGEQKMRVSDQVTLNAPEMDTRYYIIGKRPEGMFNSRYKYITTLEELNKDKDNVKVIYKHY